MFHFTICMVWVGNIDEYIEYILGKDEYIDLQVCTDVFLQYKVTNLLRAQEMRGKWEQATNL